MSSDASDKKVKPSRRLTEEEKRERRALREAREAEEWQVQIDRLMAERRAQGFPDKVKIVLPWADD